jgi:hypothetical protein
MKLVKCIDTSAYYILCFLVIDENTVLCGEHDNNFDLIDLVVSLVALIKWNGLVLALLTMK